jgi:CheY-like chemotaxis protein
MVAQRVNEGSRQVVVIDDEPSLLSVLRDLLEDEGFSVVCLDHPQQIEALKGNTDPGLFLIDIMLPGISGIELAEQLRAASYSQTPMIAMSASSFMVRTAKATGLFQETISKPFDVDEFLATVERCLA